MSGDFVEFVGFVGSLVVAIDAIVARSGRLRQSRCQESVGGRHPPSALTLAALAKHLAFVEDSWFHDDFLGVPLPEPWASAPFDDDPDWELHSAVDDDPGDLVALYGEACDRSRSMVRNAASLDAMSARISERDGTAFSLRWILLHMIEETARHNGHADFLREAIDGLVGE